MSGGTVVVGAGLVGAHLAAALMTVSKGEVVLVDSVDRRLYLGSLGLESSVPHVVGRAQDVGARVASRLGAKQVVLAMSSSQPQLIRTLCTEMRGRSRIVLISSLAVYGNAIEPVGEDSVGTAISAYGKSKLAEEARVSRVTPDHLIIRSTGLVGPPPSLDRASRSALAFSNVFAQAAKCDDEVTLKIEQIVDQYMDVRDFAIATAKLIVSGQAGVWNIGPGIKYRPEDLAQRLSKFLSRSVHLELREMDGYEVGLLDTRKLVAHLPDWHPRPLEHTFEYLANYYLRSPSADAIATY